MDSDACSRARSSSSSSCRNRLSAAHRFGLTHGDLSRGAGRVAIAFQRRMGSDLTEILPALLSTEEIGRNRLSAAHGFGRSRRTAAIRPSSRRNRLSAAHGFGHFETLMSFLRAHLLSQSPFSGAWVRTRHRLARGHLHRKSRQRVAIAFQRRMGSDSLVFRRHVFIMGIPVAIAFQRRMGSDKTTTSPWGITRSRCLSQSPFSGAWVRTTISIGRYRRRKTWCRNRLSAAHGFGPVPTRRGVSRNKVAIAFQRRMGSDALPFGALVEVDMIAVAIAFQRRMGSDLGGVFGDFALGPQISRNRLSAAHGFGHANASGIISAALAVAIAFQRRMGSDAQLDSQTKADATAKAVAIAFQRRMGSD